MRGSLSPAALRCVLSAADASLALDRFGIMPARSRVDILSTRLVFAPTVHGSAWPAAFGIIKRTDRAKRLSTTLLLRDSAHYLATPKPCRAAVEHNPIWQHRYGGVYQKHGFYKAKRRFIRRVAPRIPVLVFADGFTCRTKSVCVSGPPPCE